MTQNERETSDRLRARVAELEAALRWYADEMPDDYEIYAGGTYLCAVSWFSERARAALADSSEQAADSGSEEA